MREVEVKIKLNEKENKLLRSWLADNAEKLRNENHIEYYFNNPTSSFFFTSNEGYKDARDYLRVRKTEKGDSVCLKRFEIDIKTGKSKNTDEIEFNVSDGEEANKLLEVLGYTDKTVVNKSREYYEYDNFEIVIDKVEQLGNFAEIELKNFDEDKDIKEGFEIIYALLKSIGFTKVTYCKRGYVSMLWNMSHEFGVEKNL